MNLTEWQHTALRHPCYLAEETVRQRFCHVALKGTVIVTVDSGYE